MLSKIYDFYYPKLSSEIIFDRQAMNETHQRSLCQDSILSGKTTTDFELEKYLMCKDYEMFKFVLSNYIDKIEDWTHMIATCLMNENDERYLLSMMLKYEEQTGKLFDVNETNDEILFLFTWYDRSPQFTTVFYTSINIDEKLKHQTSFLWNKLDIKNKRNLIYALLLKDIERAKELLLQGVQANVWNDYAMIILLRDPSIKQDKELSKLLFLRGGTIPIKKMEQQPKRVVTQKSIMETMSKMISSPKIETKQQDENKIVQDFDEKHNLVIYKNQDNTVTMKLEEKCLPLNKLN